MQRDHGLSEERLVGLKRMAVNVTAVLPGDTHEALLVLGLAGDVVERFIDPNAGAAEEPPLEQRDPAWLWRGLGVILAGVAVFIADSFTPPAVPFAVLYGAVVMMAGTLVPAAQLLFGAAICMGLASGDYFLFPNEAMTPVSLANLLVSFAAIAIGTYGGARIRRAELQARSAKLELAKSSRRRLPGLRAVEGSNLVRLTRDVG